MKTKKSSLSLVLALVMVFVMASAAFATLDVTQTANGKAADAAKRSITITENIAVSGDSVHGVRAMNGGHVEMTGNITTSGDKAFGAYINGSDDVGGRGSFDLTGNITTQSSGTGNFYALHVADGGYGRMSGNIKASGVSNIYALYARYAGTVINFDGNVEVIGSTASYNCAIVAKDGGTIYVVGDIETTNSRAMEATGIDSLLDFTGNATGVYTDTDFPDRHPNTFTYLFSARDNGVLIARDSYLSYPTSLDYVWLMVADAGGRIDLINAETDADNENLLLVQDNGTVNAFNSTLTGDVQHNGKGEGTLDLNLSDSVWNGSAESSGDIGVIDIDLENSDWIVTGDTNTNGVVTGDADSNIISNSPDDVTVVIDSIVGEPGLNLKPGDSLIFENPAGNVESTNPDVIEVIQNEDGSVEIIFKEEGEAGLIYDYIDENGDLQTATLDVVSGAGAGSQTTSSGGSSNCNT
ncbi:hypothetical protein LJC40_07950, partial [Synergistaceae bacterium OttesenSCG-928-D05]|nr:hypothetical protein [Synergistaceae bacterium OttesenSCG-928-D05]